MKLDIQQICGKNTVTREDGRAINRILDENWDQAAVLEIDFGNILVASVSFIDEAFGKLALKHTKEDLQKKLVFENMVTYDRKLLNDILLSRLRQKAAEQNPKRRPKGKKTSAQVA